MKKFKFQKCFECSYHEFDPVMVPTPCGKKQRIPRKWKKRLKAFVFYSKYCVEMHRFSPVSTCQIADDFKRLLPALGKAAYLKRFADEIEFLVELSDNGGEPIALDDNLILGFAWETDGDYGGSSGIEPLHFLPNDPEDETWAYSELKSMLESIGLKIEDYRNEKALLITLKRIGTKELYRRMYNGFETAEA